MALSNYSAEASVLENGKLVRGTLTLFADEYVFGSIRKTVSWENVVCREGTVTVRGFLRSSEKPCLVFEEGGACSPQFILEKDQMKLVQEAVAAFAAAIWRKRAAEAEQKRKAAEAARRKAEEEQRQAAEEQRIREEARRKAEEEYQRKKAEELRRKEEARRKAREEFRRKAEEKRSRILRLAEACREEPEEMTPVGALAGKAAGFFLSNPFRILGISCLSSGEEANTALDKLKKLARLKALASYRSAFDLQGLPKPDRDLSIAQNALTLLKDSTHRWFWFAEPEACAAWKNGRYRMELAKDGLEFGTYDLFLANYLYGILCDPDFETGETWKRILNFYCFLCRQEDCAILRSRFTAAQLQDVSNADLLNGFRSVIFKPLLLLCERDDLDAVLRIYKYIRECDNRLLEGLTRSILSKLVSWFTDKESDMLRYLKEVNDQDTISESVGQEIRRRGEAYCAVVEPVLELVLRDFRGDTVRYDMIRESYRHATYQLMYELHKCPDQSNAIYFANKCFAYCNADDKKRILNTFGEANIKAIDWNIPHTGWDAKGDQFYYGRGCPVDYAQAMYWYRKAADAGNMHSKNSIGLCYQKGTGVPQDDAMAASWFEQACSSGNPEGAYNLAECYYSGTGVQKNVDKALKYWAEAVKLGHPSAEQRRSTVFARVQVERRAHRARNHICHDIGFQMTVGPNLEVEVTLSQAANVYLVNAQGYQNYLNGNDFSYRGGYFTESPCRIRIPSSNRWYVIVDNGDGPIAGITSRARVKNA